MISVIVYGRNDAHGYNLHRRAALSLNCIAHVLTDDDDEVIFVDYNTPPGLPVFPEAIRDTLTTEMLERLRVIRVPADEHAKRYAARTHLATLEPIARNVALRRSNPSNRWVLSTNTDMVLVPTGSGSLSEIAGELADAYWAIPRFQLPEALWERLDRQKPEVALSTIGRWGARFQLDEPITSFRWMGFDAPGDFQLVPREWLWAVDGFDEEMVLGWHVDSNLARRISLAYGPPRDLQTRVRGYHCDHTRVPGVFHEAASTSNDVEHFVFDVDRARLPTQSATWGLAGVELEEVDLASTIASRLPTALESMLPAPTRTLHPVDARTGLSLLSYPATHVLPYVASALSVLPQDAVIGYVGTNSDLVVLLTAFMREVGFSSPLRVLPTGRGIENTDRTVVVTRDEIAGDADAVIVDFGLPVASAAVPHPTRISQWRFDDRLALDRTLDLFDELTSYDAGDVPGARPFRGYVVVNAIYNFFEGVVDARLTGGGKQFATRVRHGYARRVSADVDSLPRAAFGSPSSHPVLRYRLGEYVDLTRLDSSGRVHGAWGWMTPFGTWTDDQRAGFVFDVEADELGDVEEAVFSVRIDRACDPRYRVTRMVDVEVGGDRMARWQFSGHDVDPALHRVVVSGERLRRERPIVIDLVAHALTTQPPDSSVQPDEDVIDPGLLVAGATLESVGAPLGVGDRLELVGPEIPSSLLWSGWSRPEDDGTWSIGPTAVLLVPPLRADSSVVEVVIEFADVFVRPGQDPFEVEVSVDEALRERWSFDRAGAHERRLTLEVRGVATTVRFEMPAAASCRTLGESSDPRRLGCKIGAFAIDSARTMDTRSGRWRRRGLRPRRKLGARRGSS